MAFTWTYQPSKGGVTTKNILDEMRNKADWLWDNAACYTHCADCPSHNASYLTTNYIGNDTVQRNSVDSSYLAHDNTAYNGSVCGHNSFAHYRDKASN